MAFKPNYNQQRAERNRSKAQKKQEKLQRRESEAAKRKEARRDIADDRVSDDGESSRGS